MSYYWEDLTVGFTHDFGPWTVDRDEVLDFARRYDPQPFHLDEDAAAATHFGRVAASGWHTCAMTMAAVVAYWRDVPAWQETSLGAMGLDELHWKRPVYPGDTLSGTSTLVEKIESRSKPEMGIVKLRTRVTNQDGITVLDFVAVTMRKRRPTR